MEIRLKKICITCDFFRDSSFEINGYCTKWGEKMENIEIPESCPVILEQTVLSQREEDVKETDM